MSTDISHPAGNGFPAEPTSGLESEAGAKRILAEQLALTYTQVPSALVGGVVNGLVLVYVLWGVSPRSYLLVWAGLGLTFALARSLIARKFRNAPLEDRAQEKWLWVVMATTLLSGLHMGIGSAVVFPSGSVVHQVFIAFITGGLVAGSVTTYCAFRWLAPLYFVPSILPVSLRFFLAGNEISWVMGGMTILFTILMAFIARNMHNTTYNALKLQLANEALVARLSRVNEKTEKLNSELKAEIGERIQAETALRESEEKFRGLVENSKDLIILTDFERILYANHAALELSGYSEEEFYQQPLTAFMAETPTGKEQLTARLQARQEGKEVTPQVEAQLITKRGEIRDALIASSLIQTSEGPRILSMIKDITYRKKEEAELRTAKDRAEEATRVKDRFVHLVAHDLRSPLASMSGILNLLASDQENPLPEVQKPLFELVLQSAKNLSQTIEELLGHDRLQAGSVALAPRLFDVHKAVGGTMEMLGYLAEQKKIRIQNDVPPGMILYADPQLVRKVIQNLLGNAIKFSHPGGTITVFTPEGKGVTIAVKDQGVGIHSERWSFIFDPESGSATTGTAGETGTGQGLSYCREIVKAHGGEISLDSAENQGTTFFVFFPESAPRVALVGHHALFAQLPDFQWEDFSLEFVNFAGAENWSGELAENGVNLIIAGDLGNGGGREVVEKIRGNPKLRSTPIILLLPTADVENLDLAFQGGANEILINPTTPAELSGKIRQFVK